MWSFAIWQLVGHSFRAHFLQFGSVRLVRAREHVRKGWESRAKYIVIAKDHMARGAREFQTKCEAEQATQGEQPLNTKN